MPAAFVLELRGCLELILGRIHHRRPLLVVFDIGDFNGLRAHDHVAIAHPEKPANRHDVTRQLIFRQDQILDLADRLVGIVYDIEIDEVVAEMSG